MLRGRLRHPVLPYALAAVALVMLRSAVPLVMERSLDSDQAVVGLMAKHLSEGRAFPLFFYGQHYMLGVQAWIAAPFFWIGGPTAIMLRLPLLLINAGLVVALLVTFVRYGLRPWQALIAVLPLAITTPVMSDALLRPLGAAIEPFAWVALLWALRARPVWWGMVLVVGTLHREFVIYALPALALAQWRDRRWWTARDGLLALAGAIAVWVAIDLLKRQINLYGPSGGAFMAESLILQPQQIAQWLSLDAWASRVVDIAMRGVPDMFGARSYRLADYHGMFSALSAGSLLAGVALGTALVLATIRLLPRWRRPAECRDGLGVYFATIGIFALGGYGLNGGIDLQAMPVVRYALFVVYLPVGILLAFFLHERRPVLARGVSALVAVWATFTAIDAGRVIHEYASAPPVSPHREMADFLVESGITHARAQYWDAYVITFLARERAIVASTGKLRIAAYRAAADADPHTVELDRQPCSTGLPVSAWCVVGR
jgi:hypothetical protein